MHLEKNIPEHIQGLNLSQVLYITPKHDFKIKNW
jgi:hypothetical protein